MTPTSQYLHEAYRLMKLPSTYAGIILLFIASALISLPEMPPTAKDFLMVAFSCVALLPKNDFLSP